MRTNERYLKRIVIPVVAVAALLIVGNLIVRVVTKDEVNVENAVEATPDGTENQYQGFSEAKVAIEATAMEKTLTSLDRALEAEAEPSQIEELRTDEVKQKRREAEESIQALRTANEENWQELKQEAYEQIQGYAQAIGQKLPEPGPR